MLFDAVHGSEREVCSNTEQVYSVLILFAGGYGIVAIQLLDYRHTGLFYADLCASFLIILTIPVSPRLLPIESSRPKIS